MYTHKVQYYETDRMGITHHSNYLRWMEEARIDLLSKTGWGYDRMEAMGVISPVIGINCKYIRTTTFGDTVDIAVSVEENKGVKLKLNYMMMDQNGEKVFEGHSEHCFLNAQKRPVSIKKEFPELFAALNLLAEQ